MALFYQKKSFYDTTNYSGIKNYNFYSKKNIFLLGEESLEQLPYFFETPFVPYCNKELEEYEVDSWAKRFTRK